LTLQDTLVNNDNSV